MNEKLKNVSVEEMRAELLRSESEEKNALAIINKQLEIAREAIAEATRLGTQYKIEFYFDIGDQSLTFNPEAIDTYSSGWQSSSDQC